MFEKAVRTKMRVSTPKGSLSVEDLWDLTPEALDPVAINLKKELEETKEGSFLKSTSTAERKVKDQFDIVLYILKTKVQEREDRANAAVRKEKRDELLAILADKENEETRGMSKEEILKQIEELG